MFALFTFLLTFSVIESTTDMFIFWGYPTDGTDGCVDTTAASFDDCVSACDTSATCILAYGNDTSCMLCDMFLVTSIAQSDRENGVKTAVIVDAPSDGCPSDMESEEYTRTDTNDAYNLTYSDGVWTITYENKSCLDSTWTKFYRPLGQWCMKVLGSSSPLNQDSANSTCFSLGATNSAIQSAEELNFIITTSKNLTGSLTKYTYTGVWMNGLRYGSCNFADAEDTAACAGIKMFALTDKYLSSTSQYTFIPGQPDSVTDRGSRHNCLAVLVSQSQSAYQGMTYNALCMYSCNAASTVCMTNFVCGRAAT